MDRQTPSVSIVKSELMTWMIWNYPHFWTPPCVYLPIFKAHGPPFEALVSSIATRSCIMKVLALSVKPVLPQMGVVQQGMELHPLVMVLECCGQT